MPDPVLTPIRYPHHKSEGYTQESPATAHHNCVAWAVGDTTAWWWPDQAAYWPPECPLEVTIEAFILMFASLGFVECADGSPEPGYEKTALYTLNNVPTHTAHQQADGDWSSKMGQYIDIKHTLRGLEGPRYESVVKFLKRAIS